MKTKNEKPEPGHDCPDCLLGTVCVTSSPTTSKYRTQYLGCSKKCGWSGKRVVPIGDAPRVPSRKRK